MDMTISVSERTAEIIRHKAEENGTDAAEFAANLLEEKVAAEFSENAKESLEDNYKNPFTPFIKMFSSGKTDTSSRYKQILMEEVDKRGGFGGS